jgi:hypothetical protein
MTFKRGDRVVVVHLGKTGTVLSSHRMGWAGPVVLVRLDDRKGYPRAMRCQERVLERLSERGSTTGGSAPH